MKKIENFFIFFVIFKIISCIPTCEEGKNNCTLCHPFTHLCLKCNSKMYIPDENGGCDYLRKCISGNNYCFECSEKEELCKTCDVGYYPDKIGGCSYSDNCEISYKGECIKCNENFILVGINNDLKICKSLISEDLKNCEEVDIQKGICDSCKEGYYLNSGDQKCIKTENCTESSFGFCKKCNSGYYLDKQKNECLLKEEPFTHCIQTLDGKVCDICDDNYFFDSQNNCIKSNFCEKSNKNGDCTKCISGKFLSSYDKSCTDSENCYFGMSNIGVCEICDDGYYMDFTDGKCKSYEKNEEFKFCRKAEEGVCYECIATYFLSEDNKCSKSKNCVEVDNGKCIECMEGFHLGLDDICTYVENCIYSSPFFDSCLECEDGYFFDLTSDECNLTIKDEFKNCRRGFKDLYCEECKKNYYLNQKDNLCHSNTLKDKMYKCALSDKKGTSCIRCEEDFFLSYHNNLCIDTDGCNVAEDGHRCLECNEYHCLDVKTGKCEINQYIEKEEQKIYFRCNRTNEEGNSCEICKNDSLVIKNGFCFDDVNCEERNDDGSCLKCRNDENDAFCLNNNFGCVETYTKNCLECNNIFNFRQCDKCIDGYEIDENGECAKIE